jgi:polysaccharide export outer membrane protein
VARRVDICGDRNSRPVSYRTPLLRLPQDVLGWVRILARVAVLSAAAVHGGCSTLPTSGPASSSVRDGQSNPESLPYAFVRLTPEVDEILERNSSRIGKVFVDRRGPSEIRFGVGDVVSVTLFESMPGGLFIPIEAGVRPGNFITLPNQAVDTKGNISIPYAGKILAKGRTAEEVQEAIVRALSSRAIEPQAVVALVDQRASSVSVLGEVGTPSRFPASASGERLLDAIARAGGPKNPGYDTWVMLDRDGRQATAPFAALVNEKGNNIYVRPQDTIYVYTQPQTFLAFGASGAASGAISGGASGGTPGQQGQFPFGAWRLSLAEAIAKAGGLNDNRADPASVFLYRGEPREVAQQLGVDCSRFSGPVVPIIYNLNLRDPAGYFLASKFEMRNKDVIFASNATSVEATKFLVYLRMIIGTVSDPMVAAISAYTLKGLAAGGATNTTVIATR